MGYNSIYVVSIIAIMTGGISVIQTTYALSSPLIQDYIIGMVVRDTTFALIPTLIALVFAGKVGSGMAGELGTMRISEQIDAIEVMGINPASYLVLPKILAAIVMLPVLVAISCFLGLFSGFIVVSITGLISGTDYIYGIRSGFDSQEVSVIFTKAIVDGFLVSSISSFNGYRTSGGALDVGRSNTRSIVISSIMIVIADLLITQLYGPSS